MFFAGLLPGGIAIVDGDIPQLGRVIERASAFDVRNVLTFGLAPEATARITDMNPQSHSTDVVAMIHGRQYTYRVGVPGHHGVKKLVGRCTRCSCTWR